MQCSPRHNRPLWLHPKSFHSLTPALLQNGTAYAAARAERAVRMEREQRLSDAASAAGTPATTQSLDAGASPAAGAADQRDATAVRPKLSEPVSGGVAADAPPVTRFAVKVTQGGKCPIASAAKQASAPGVTQPTILQFFKPTDSKSQS